MMINETGGMVLGRAEVAVRMPHKDPLVNSRLLDCSTPSTSSGVPLMLRPLLPIDLPSVQSLCIESFPITYPESWYDEVVSGQLISWGLFDGRRLAAILVAETKPLYHCNIEDRGLLSDPHAHVVYLMSLAVATPFRRMGLATHLLKHLLNTMVTTQPHPRAVFLHVLSTNYAAINFYQSNGFVHHETLLNYYKMENTYGDGHCYVLYTNGARPPMSFGEICRSFSTALCFPVKALLKVALYLST